MTDSPGATRQRRRGPELEAALLEAAWDELDTVGYARLTMESVATRANTGVAVLYRRWSNKDELVLAALEHRRSSRLVPLADTGTLRGDLVAALTRMSEGGAMFFAIAAAIGSGLLAGTGLTPTQVRDRIMGDGRLNRSRSIYERAAARGEIDLDRTPQAVLDLPFDLIRHDLLMDLQPPSPARITAIVDEVSLPLLRQYLAETH
jgi:AcrR family transcriptional regulator